VLLAQIKDHAGILVCDHLWFNVTKAFAALHLQPGETVSFEARVQVYWKGYQGRREEVWKPVEQNYKLSHPTKVRRVESTQEDTPLFALEGRDDGAYL
jgi:hypothetical protein